MERFVDRSDSTSCNERKHYTSHIFHRFILKEADNSGGQGAEGQHTGSSCAPFLCQECAATAHLLVVEVWACGTMKDTILGILCILLAGCCTSHCFTSPAARNAGISNGAFAALSGKCSQLDLRLEARRRCGSGHYASAPGMSCSWEC